MEFRCLKTLFFINFELDIHCCNYNGLNLEFRAVDSDLNDTEWLSTKITACDLIDKEKYDFVYNSEYKTIEDKICSLRLQAEILDNLNKDKKINVQVNFKLNKNKKVSYELVKYKGNKLYRKFIEDSLEGFCDLYHAKDYIWGDKSK